MISRCIVEMPPFLRCSGLRAARRHGARRRVRAGSVRNDSVCNLSAMTVALQRVFDMGGLRQLRQLRMAVAAVGDRVHDRRPRSCRAPSSSATVGRRGSRPRGRPPPSALRVPTRTAAPRGPQSRNSRTIFATSAFAPTSMPRVGSSSSSSDGFGGEPAREQHLLLIAAGQFADRLIGRAQLDAERFDEAVDDSPAASPRRPRRASRACAGTRA